MWTNDSTKQLLKCWHRTRYEYGGPVRSSHNFLRLLPRTDRRQWVKSCEIVTYPETSLHPFNDCFGNQVFELSLEQEHSSLTIESTSVVAITLEDPFTRLPSHEPLAFPVTWTEADIQALHPYLATGIENTFSWNNLIGHARDRAIENRHIVTETLFALNLEIFREFQYLPGSTSFDTHVTAVFENRQGVCQDFASLFIAWARALGLPARYVWGYMLIGDGDHPPVGAGATHAWAEVFLPMVGWLGFDPTNGVLADDKYVAVAHGRSPFDAPPIQGDVIPAVTQTLDVQVEVTRIDPPQFNSQKQGLVSTRGRS